MKVTGFRYDPLPITYETCHTTLKGFISNGPTQNMLPLSYLVTGFMNPLLILCYLFKVFT